MDEKSTDPKVLDHHLAFVNYFNGAMLRAENPTTYADLLKAGTDRLEEIAATFYPLCLL